MPGDFYGSFSIPHDELSRQRQLSQLQRGSSVPQENGARRSVAALKASEAHYGFDEALRSSGLVEARRL